MARCHERTEALAGRARRSVLARLADNRRHLDGCGKLLSSLSYHGVLQRGYALVRDGDGRTLRSSSEVVAGQLIDIELADGHVGAQALTGGARERGKPEPSSPRVPPRPKPGPQGGGQGSLF
jgi:exodeoxyribonuclease VII large subunit